jgi:hypothetical protein
VTFALPSWLSWLGVWCRQMMLDEAVDPNAEAFLSKERSEALRALLPRPPDDSGGMLTPTANHHHHRPSPPHWLMGGTEEERLAFAWCER